MALQLQHNQNSFIDKAVLAASKLLMILCITLLIINSQPCGCTSLKWESEHAEPKEVWAYVTVRPGAHMFYWLYHTTHAAGYENSPLILWLQGGPGASSTGFGNFEELGPLDTSLNPRNTTWLQSASLLFIDNPVGTGYSYAESPSAFTTNLQEICQDLLAVMKEFVKSNPVAFQTTPFYIFSESYGGKMTAGFSSYLHNSIKNNEINLNFQGLAMGDSWISPVDFTNSWGPYLYATSIISMSGLKKIEKSAAIIEDLVNKGDFENATKSWSALEDLVEEEGAGVNFYNIMKWGQDDIQSINKQPRSHVEKLYARHVQKMQKDDIDALMNGPIREKLMIIPNHVKWGGQSADVFKYQSSDFMRNVTSTVNDLINNTNLTVVVYNGQLDLICDVLGTESWFYKLDISPQIQQAKRVTYPCAGKSHCYFGKQVKNVHFYWILDAGHMVPQDNGPGALSMLNQIIG